MDVWVAIAITVATNLLTAGIAYGLLVGRVRALEQTAERLERTKASAEAFDGVTRSLTDLRRDLDRRLDRIENWVAPTRHGRDANE